MMQIPLQPVPSQTLSVLLGAQRCQIAIYVKGINLYVDLISNGYPVSIGVIARDFVSLVPSAYLGFIGTLLFNDSQGSNDPSYDGLGERYQLIYLTGAEYGLIR